MIKILITAIVTALITGVVVTNVNKTELSDQPSSDNGSVIEVNNSSDISDTKEGVEVVEKEEAVPITDNTGKTLDLSGKSLAKTPDYVFGRTDIQELNLSNNNLGGALQAEVRHLQDLLVLNMSDNDFTGVPAEIGQLKNLETLNLSNNQLTGLPYELGNLMNLKLLDLRGNDYSSLDLNIIKEGLLDTVIIKTD